MLRAFGRASARGDGSVKAEGRATLAARLTVRSSVRHPRSRVEQASEDVRGDPAVAVVLGVPIGVEAHAHLKGSVVSPDGRGSGTFAIVE